MSTPQPPPEGFPRFFLDRSVGRKIVPAGLRRAGIELVTVAERYGIAEDEQVIDVQWRRDAAAHGEAEVVARFVSNLPAIERACRRDGPFVYRIHPDRIERRALRSGS